MIQLKYKNFNERNEMESYIMTKTDKLALYHYLVDYRFSLSVDDEICASIEAVMNQLKEDMENEL